MIMMWVGGLLTWLVGGLLVGVVVGKSIRAADQEVAARGGHPGGTAPR